MSMELLFIDTGFQDRKSDLQDSKSNWTSLFRIVPASDGGLEGEVDERYLTVARADDAEVELEVWRIPGETEEEIAARQVL